MRWSWLWHSPAASSSLRERLSSLPWALPYLIFVIVSAIVTARTDPDHAIPMVVWLTVFILVYVTTWIRSDPAPVSRAVDPWVVATIVVLAALICAALPFADGASVIYFLPYVAAVMVLQLPQHLYMRWVSALVIGAVVFSAVAVITGHLALGEAAFELAILVCTVFMTLMARRAIDHHRDENIRQAERLQVSQSTERSRISADLHDVLGQTLTAINVNAQVVGRLADLGKIDEGLPYLKQLQELSHDALVQMRQVVAATREADVEEELAQASHLADAAGIVLSVDNGGFPPEGKTSQVAAHLVREAMTNVIHHSGADRVWVELSPTRVSVRDNGQGARPNTGRRTRVSEPAGRVSTGLTSLKNRAEGVGIVTWGPAEGGGWHVTFVATDEAGSAEVSTGADAVGETIHESASEGAR